MDLRIDITNLAHFNHGDDDEAQEWVLDVAINYPDDLRILRQQVARAHNVRRKTLQYIADVRAFFSPESFQTLAAFGHSSLNAHRFLAAHNNGEFRIGITPAGAIRVKPDWTTLNDLPAWPDIQTDGKRS